MTGKYSELKSKGGVERRLQHSLIRNATLNLLFDVMLRGFFRMVSSMQVVTVGDVGMMRGLFMARAGIVLGASL